jgi:hypothetical protein
MCRLVGVQREPDLFEIIATRYLPGGTASGLDRRQQQSHERADDANRNQQLDERESDSETGRVG